MSVRGPIDGRSSARLASAGFISPTPSRDDVGALAGAVPGAKFSAPNSFEILKCARQGDEVAMRRLAKRARHLAGDL
jgi:hypothetical protein